MSKKVAVLVEENVHDLEFWYPFYRIAEAGFEPVAVGPAAGKVYTGKLGTTIEAAASPSDLSPSDVAGVVVPGGWAPDRLRTHKSIVDFVRAVSASGGVVAAICHGGSVLVSAGILRGVRATSYKSIRDDMVLAGADWVDEPAVVSGNLVTSRTPADLPAFGKALVEALEAK
jgi:protease I